MGGENCANLGAWAIEEVTQHCPVLHALKWTWHFCGGAIHFNFHAHESVKPVLEYDVDAVSG
jgi:hypothetical protein